MRLLARPAAPLAFFAMTIACAGSHREAPPPELAPPPPPIEVDAGPPAPIAPVVFEDTGAPDGPACTATADCEAGLACRGPAGCGAAWACGQARACEPETIAYCDCDGSTFYAPSGCAGRSYMHVGSCRIATDEVVLLGVPDSDEPLTTADRTCSSTSDCRASETCFGAPGCASILRCERVRRCRRDRTSYCGCDGRTFTASSNCPGRPFMHSGACREDETLVASADPDAGVPSTPVPPIAVVPPTLPDAGTETPSVVASAPPDAGRSARACDTSADCPRPRICTGPAGCGFTWTCERPPPERCNPDTQVFCDCEGETFRASMNCPGRIYAHRGSCEIDRLLDLAGGALR